MKNVGGLIVLMVGLVMFWPVSLRAQTLPSEQATCQQHNLQSGIRGVNNQSTCFGTFSDAQSGTNGIACESGAQACCASAAGQPSCFDRTVNFTSAPPSSTATQPSSTRSAGGIPVPNTVIKFIPEVPLPNFVGGVVSGTTIAQYIRAVFIYFIWAVGILAVVMVTYGGILWVAAAGNAARINNARTTINNALIGLIIALTSVALLTTINPSLTKFGGLTPVVVTQEVLNLDSVQGENNEAGTCRTKNGTPVQQEATCAVSSKNFTWPLSDATKAITSRMGPRASNGVQSTCHPGTDFSTDQKSGKRVVAMFDGTIASISPFCNESTVKVISPQGFYARYVHVHSTAVSVGTVVKQGDTIGFSGGDPSVASACSTGPHLHVEVYDSSGVLHDVYPCLGF